MPSTRFINQPPGMGRQRITPQGTSGPQTSPNPPQVQYVEDWFIYNLNVLGLAAGGTANANIQIDADSDFKLVKLGMNAAIPPVVEVTESLREVPQVTMMIVDTGAGRNLFNAPVAMGAIWGGGGLPFILPVPRIFKARTNISFTFVNFNTADTYDLRMAFIGNKIFAQGLNI